MGFIFIGTALILFFYMFKSQLSGGFFQIKTISLNDIVERKIFKYGLNKNLVKAIIKVESGGNSKAMNPGDPSYGLMQITPILAESYGLIDDAKNLSSEDISSMMDISNNAEIGCWFLAYLLRKYSQAVAIQMYNLGESGYLSGKRATSYLDSVLSWYGVYNVSGGFWSGLGDLVY